MSSLRSEKNYTVQAEEKKIKDTLRSINPKMGLANVAANHDVLTGTKFDNCPVIGYHLQNQILMSLHIS